MRVLSWNLWWRFGDWHARQDAILATLAAVRPDVCGLQEVWATTDANQAEWLAGKLGMHWAYSASPVPDRWQSRIGDGAVGVGNAVLSRWPITGRSIEHLPAGDEPDDGRTALHARLDAPGGPVPFFTTHLNSAPHQSGIRCAQAAALARFVAGNRSDSHPPVVTGDFNAEPDSDEIRLIGGHLTAPAAPGLVLIDAWRHTDGSSPGWTWDCRNPHVKAYGIPSSRIDYILVGPPWAAAAPGRGAVERVQLAGDLALDGVWPSDHAAVVADLRD